MSDKIHQMVEIVEKPSSHEIRLLEEKDLPEVAAVYAAAFNAMDIGEEWSQQAAEGLMRYWFEKQPDLFFVAAEGEKIIGGIVFGVKPWFNGPHLTDGEIFTHPEHQGKGVAKSLLKKEVEEAISKYGIVEVEAIADKEH